MPTAATQLLSSKKTRQAVVRTIGQVNAQRDVLVQAVGLVNQHQSILSRPFLGRLRWLIRGK